MSVPVWLAQVVPSNKYSPVFGLVEGSCMLLDGGVEGLGMVEGGVEGLGMVEGGVTDVTVAEGPGVGMIRPVAKGKFSVPVWLAQMTPSNNYSPVFGLIDGSSCR